MNWEAERRPIERLKALPAPRYPREHREEICAKMRRIVHAMTHGHADGTAYGADYDTDYAWVYQGRKAGA